MLGGYIEGVEEALSLRVRNPNDDIEGINVMRKEVSTRTSGWP